MDALLKSTLVSYRPSEPSCISYVVLVNANQCSNLYMVLLSFCFALTSSALAFRYCEYSIL